MYLDKYIIKRCDLFGEIVYFRNRIDIKNLKRVLETYGANSKQFYFMVQGFVLWGMTRYLREEVIDKEEVFQQCMYKVIEAMQEYDKEKGNIANFLHAVIRNEISKYNYRIVVKESRIIEINEIKEDYGVTDFLEDSDDRIYDWKVDFFGDKDET